MNGWLEGGRPARPGACGADLEDDRLAQARRLLEADFVGQDDLLHEVLVARHDREPHVGRERLGEGFQPEHPAVHVNGNHRRLELVKARHVLRLAWLRPAAAVPSMPMAARVSVGVGPGSPATTTGILWRRGRTGHVDGRQLDPIVRVVLHDGQIVPLGDLVQLQHALVRQRLCHRILWRTRQYAPGCESIGSALAA